jgi:hypothetical protein
MERLPRKRKAMSSNPSSAKRKKKKNELEPGVVVHACNISPQKDGKFKARLGYLETLSQNKF